MRRKLEQLMYVNAFEQGSTRVIPDTAVQEDGGRVPLLHPLLECWRCE